MSMYKTVYIGHVPQCAEYIYHNDAFKLVGMICEQDRMSNEILTFSLVRGIQLDRIIKKDDLCEKIKEYGSDTVFVMYGFSLRIPMEFLEGYRIFNIHASNLPQYKGAQPTYWATIKNEKQIGVSLFQITEQLDDGDIMAQEMLPYYLWENEDDLQKKIRNIIPKLLQCLTHYLESPVILKKNASGDYYPKVSKEDVFINLEADSPQMIFNKVRAEAAFEGAKINIRSDGDYIFSVKELFFSEETIKEPFKITDDGILKIKYKENLILYCKKYKQIE